MVTPRVGSPASVTMSMRWQTESELVLCYVSVQPRGSWGRACSVPVWFQSHGKAKPWRLVEAKDTMGVRRGLCGRWHVEAQSWSPQNTAAGGLERPCLGLLKTR